MPQDRPWLTFAEWEKKYGELIYVDILGKPIVIINSTRIAKELLDKRSSIYSDRPHFVMAGAMRAEGLAMLSHLSFNHMDWRRQRRLVSHEFSANVIPRYCALQEKETRLLFKNALADPSILVSELKLAISPRVDACIWFPSEGHGCTFRLNAHIFKETGDAFMPNLCGTTLSKAGGSLSADDEEKLIWASSTVMGGLDTNVSSALSFVVAMIKYPEVQKKAQAEIDVVIGLDRLPLISDSESLPYARSIMAEVLRWNPAVPTGVAHALTQDDVYEGFYIPKGAILMPNVRKMLHDPEIYENPMEFIPERYNNLESEWKKIPDLVLGFGRRVCPGLHFAEATLFSTIVMALATCDILPELDEHGKGIIPDVKYTTGTISFPSEFPYRLKPRSAKASALLAQTPTLPE